MCTWLWLITVPSNRVQVRQPFDQLSFLAANFYISFSQFSLEVV